jgi:hypothetical protein
MMPRMMPTTLTCDCSVELDAGLVALVGGFVGVPVGGLEGGGGGVGI